MHPELTSILVSLTIVLLQALLAPLHLFLLGHAFVSSILTRALCRRPLPPPQHVAITGAASGIGAALARSYAQPGVRLTLSDVHHAAGVIADCEARGASVHFSIVDVTHRASTREWIVAADGRNAIDLLVACAGVASVTVRGHIGGGASVPPSDPDDDIEDVVQGVMGINVNGVVNTVMPMVKRFKERRGGQVAIVASLASYVTSSVDPAYSASKAAVRSLAVSLRYRLHAHNVRVSAIAPGFIATPLTSAFDAYQPFKIDLDTAVRAIVAGLQADMAIITFPYAMAAIAQWAGCMPSALAELYAHVARDHLSGGYAPAGAKLDFTARTAAPSATVPHPPPVAAPPRVDALLASVLEPSRVARVVEADVADEPLPPPRSARRRKSVKA